jgi:hypothetical protein
MEAVRRVAKLRFRTSARTRIRRTLRPWIQSALQYWQTLTWCCPRRVRDCSKKNDDISSGGSKKRKSYAEDPIIMAARKLSNTNN